jgi:hypothetical protein
MQDVSCTPVASLVRSGAIQVFGIGKVRRKHAGKVESQEVNNFGYPVVKENVIRRTSQSRRRSSRGRGSTVFVVDSQDMQLGDVLLFSCVRGQCFGGGNPHQ